MANNLTIHFHSKHYKETSLPFLQYIIVLLYEQRENWIVKELVDILRVSDRTAIRARRNLAHAGYLQRKDDGTYCLTDKLYRK